MVLIHSLKVSTEHALSFVMCYGTIVCDNTGTTPNTLYTNNKYAHNTMYAIYWGHKERLKIGVQGCKES